MKAIKNVVVTMLIISLLITSSALAAPQFSDTENSPYQEAIEVLAALEMIKGYDDGTYLPEKTMTRAELATIVTRVRGLDAVVEGSNGVTGFSDVPTDHWASKYVAVAKDQGIIDGYPDGTYKPDDEITYEQVIKLLVAAAGYTPDAENNGGYPFGYIYSATTTGIIDQVTGITYTQPAMRGIVAQFAYNALNVDLMVPTSVDGAGRITYKILDGQTMLTEYHKIYKNKGLIAGFGAAKLYPTMPNYKADEAVIGGIAYKTGEVDLSGLLGYTVDYYYRTDNTLGTNTLIYTKPTEQQEVIKLTEKNLGYITNMGMSGSKFNYWANPDTDTKERSINVSPNFVMVYNNAALSKMDMKATDFNISTGEITWFDTDMDSTYDLAIIKAYKSYGVKSTSSSTKTIALQTNSESRGSIDLSAADADSTYKVSYTYLGEPATFADIKPNNVISIAQSKNEKNTEIIISDATVEGTITGTKTVKGKVRYTIDGQEYEVTNEFKGSLNLNTTSKFYLSFDGKLAYANAGFNVSKYGMLITVAHESEGLDAGAQFEILTTKNEFSVFTSKDTINFNGRTTPVADVVRALKSGTQTLRQIVTYKIDGNNNVIKLNTKAGGASIEDPILPRVDSSGQEVIENLIYRPKTAGEEYHSFKGLFYVKQSETIVFRVVDAGNVASISTVDKSKISALTIAECPFDYNTYWDVLPYNLTDSVAPVMILFGGGDTASTNSNFFIYDNYNEAITSDDEPIIQVTGYQNTRKITLDVIKESAIHMFKEATPGSLFFIARNSENQITSAQSYVDPGKLTLGSKTGNVGSDKELLVALVDQVMSLGAIAHWGDAANETKPFPMPSNVVLVDDSTGIRKISSVPGTSVRVGDVIAARSIYDGVVEVAIYRAIPIQSAQ